MRAKPTPGPWKVILDDPEQRFEIHHESEESEPGCIAHVFAADADDMYSEAMANARLIAAAPDLLAALTGQRCFECRQWIEVTPGDRKPCDECADAIAAIRKALGMEVSDVAGE